MKSNPSFLIISVLITFFFAAHECNVISRRDADETVQKVKHQLDHILYTNEYKIRNIMFGIGDNFVYTYAGGKTGRSDD